MEEFRIDMRKPEEADPAEGIRCLIPKNTMRW